MKALNLRVVVGAALMVGALALSGCGSSFNCGDKGKCSKDVAPSATLRQWFSHDPKKWSEFQQRYFAELDRHPEACEPIRSAARHGRVTLIYDHRTGSDSQCESSQYCSARTYCRLQAHSWPLSCACPLLAQLFPTLRVPVPG